MSNPTQIYGYIKEFYPKREEYEHFRVANDEALKKLPAEDDHPSLCRSSFSVTGRETDEGSFRGMRLIYFAGHYNHIQDVMDEWLSKFESFLSTLYWQEAVVHHNSGWIGPYFSLRYSITQEIANAYFENNKCNIDECQIFAHTTGEIYPKLSDLEGVVGKSRVKTIKNTHNKRLDDTPTGVSA